jgi:hypothetical protein
MIVLYNLLSKYFFNIYTSSSSLVGTGALPGAAVPPHSSTQSNSKQVKIQPCWHRTCEYQSLKPPSVMISPCATIVLVTKSPRFIQYYKTVAILLLNTIVLFVIINIVLLAVIHLRNTRSSKEIEKQGLEQLDHVPLQKVYPGYTQQEIEQLLHDTWDRGLLEFEEFTHFKERAFQSTYVNVSPHGYRLTVPQGPWPPDPTALTIFLFGGSTTFGYAVADSETIATYLQKELRAAYPEKTIWVYNFGRGYYYSAQEAILFQRLLVHNHTPDIAIFLDGLNDFAVGYADKPGSTEALHRFIEEQHKYRDASLSTMVARFLDKIQPEAYRWYDNLPVMRFTKYLQRLPDKATAPPAEPRQAEAQTYGNQAVLEGVVQRYFAQKKMIEAVSRAYQVTSVFVIQPVPFYKYDLRYHLFYKGGSDPRLLTQCDLKCYSLYGYPILASALNKNDSNNLLWLADMQEAQRKPLYIDTVHYTADMSRQIAARVHDYLQERQLLSPGL